MANSFAKIEFAVGGLLLAVITVLVFVAAVMRFYGHPLIWSVDLAQALFIWLCFVGATKAMRERSHLGVDLLVRLFGYRTRLVIETAVAGVSLLFLATLAVEGYRLTMLNTERQFGDSGLSYAFVTVAVPVGSVFLGAAIVTNLLQAWRSRIHDETLIFTKTSLDPAGQVSEL